MLPIYQRLGMSRLTLTACVGLGAGAMNMLPWGGPTARAAATVGVEANEVWTLRSPLDRRSHRRTRRRLVPRRPRGQTHRQGKALRIRRGCPYSRWQLGRAFFRR